MSKKPQKISLGDMTAAELEIKAKELKGAVGKARLEASLGKERNVRKVFNWRKERARALTLISVKRAGNKL